MLLSVCLKVEVFAKHTSLAVALSFLGHLVQLIDKIMVVNNSLSGVDHRTKLDLGLPDAVTY